LYRCVTASVPVELLFTTCESSTAIAPDEFMVVIHVCVGVWVVGISGIIAVSGTFGPRQFGLFFQYVILLIFRPQYE